MIAANFPSQKGKSLKDNGGIDWKTQLLFPEGGALCRNDQYRVYWPYSLHRRGSPNRPQRSGSPV